MRPSSSFLKTLRSFPSHTSGLALIEFTVLFPIFLLLVMGCVEMTRLIQIHHRVAKTSYLMTDMVSQYLPATTNHGTAEITQARIQNDVLAQFSRVMQPYDNTAQQAIIITSVRKEGGVVRVKWQAGGGGTLMASDAQSIVNGAKVQAIPTTANGPVSGSFAAQLAAMPEGENMLIGEVFYGYQPLWQDLVGGVSAAYGRDDRFATSTVITKRMYFRPRHGDMACLPDAFIYADCL